MKQKQLEDFLETWLEDYSLEDLYEKFNVTPFEVFLCTFNAGLIDEELLERYIPTDDL